MVPRRAVLIAWALLAGCAVMRPPPDPMPTIVVPGLQMEPRALVVVLPGFIYDADDLRDFGVAEAIHKGWPEVDVVLVGATIQYYWLGLLASRLHEQVIAPARRQGYRDVWLAGGSLGGTGVLLYEWAHPGELAGLVLFSPSLGSDRVLDEIRDAGGVAEWEPGPLPAEMDRGNYSRHIWRMMKRWNPADMQRVWLACGTEDHLFEDVEVLAPKVPPAQYFAGPGGHDWDFWLAMLPEVFGKIRTEQPLPARRAAAIRRALAAPAAPP